jgi:uncharacterized membrane protein YhaH (DUF805 family)
MERAIAELLPLMLISVLTLWMTVRILHKAGYSGWWSLLMLIPLLNIAVIWVFAFADWPALKARR